MNILPSLLVASTLIGSTQSIQLGNSCTDASIIQKQFNKPCIRGQIIIGNTSNLESILDKLCINLDEIMNNCSRPDFPDVESPTPDQESTPPTEDIPDTNIPDTNIPDTNIPDTNIPEDEPVIPEERPETDESITNKSYVEQVVALVNKERSKLNLPMLTMSEDLNYAAQIRAVETTQSFSHTRPDGSSCFTVLSENNISYRGAGENIAWGQKTPEEVVNAWMNSAGHRANILNKNFTTIGIGYYVKNSTPYWTQLFTY